MNNDVMRRIATLVSMINNIMENLFSIENPQEKIEQVEAEFSDLTTNFTHAFSDDQRVLIPELADKIAVIHNAFANASQYAKDYCAQHSRSVELAVDYLSSVHNDYCVFFNKAFLEAPLSYAIFMATAYIELIKLSIHAKLYPHHKIAWIGTARAVDATIRNNQDDFAVYYNPESKYNTWELNRAWIQTAAILKYTFFLVEQHFPNIERTIISGSSTKFILELVKEVREEKVRSQYTRGDSPTAASQEALLLLMLGYRGYKDEENHLMMSPPATYYPILGLQEDNGNVVGRLRRSHSCPDFFRAAPPPPFEKLQENFEIPRVVIS